MGRGDVEEIKGACCAAGDFGWGRGAGWEVVDEVGWVGDSGGGGGGGKGREG